MPCAERSSLAYYLLFLISFVAISQSFRCQSTVSLGPRPRVGKFSDTLFAPNRTLKFKTLVRRRVGSADRDQGGLPSTITDTVTAFDCSISSYVLASAMADLTQRFPPELLAEILGHVPGLDVLRFKQARGQQLPCRLY